MDKEYMTAILTEYKLVKRKYDELINTLHLWQKRVTLAAEKGEPDLQTAAVKRIRELQEDLFRMEETKSSLERELETEKHADKEREMPEVSDSEELLSRLQKAAGKDAGLNEKLGRLSVESELERLKNDLKE